VITTVAGTGTNGYSGDGGPASSAALGGPAGIALDSAGNLYIADAYNYRVRKVSANGVITTVAGNGTAGYSGDNGPATSAQLRSIYGVAVDSAGNLYIADTDNNRIREVSKGTITTLAGTGTVGYSGDNGPATSARFSSPWSVAVDSAGSLYIADLFNNALRKVSGGTITTIAGGGAGFSGGGPVNGVALTAPNGVTVDAAGNLYIADTGHHRILQLIPPAPTIGSFSTFCVTQCVGTSQPTLTVGGTGFLAGAVVEWNGAPLTTVFVSGSQLTATVPASLESAYGLVSLTVVNPGGAVSNALTWSQYPPLTVTASSLPAGTVGTAYQQTLSAGGGDPPYNNWVLNSGALPPGLTLDANAGTISGVPTSAAGSPYSFSVIVKDSLLSVSPALNFSISISQPAALAIVTASPLPAGGVGIPYAQQAIVAAGGTAPYTNWAVTAGSLPPGMGLMNVGVCQDPLIGTQLPNGCIVWGNLSGTPTAAGAFTFTVQTTDAANATATKQFSLTINPAGAISINPGGIVNSASYDGGGVSPGEVVTIFGSGLGPNTLASMQVGANGKVATTLAGVQILFGGVPAPLIYVQASQASAVVPYEVAGKSSTQVQVAYQGQTSSPVTVPVVLTAPGIFTLNYSGSGAGTVLNQDGTINSPNNPAAAGSLVSIYATGEGPTNPSGGDGQLDGSPAPQPLQLVTATIGGVSALVKSASGVTGAVAGIVEVVLQVPATLASASAAPVALNIGGAASQAGVTLSVKGAAQGASSDPLN
jgi:uncharacterized protein (TIGR03437 family)